MKRLSPIISVAFFVLLVQLLVMGCDVARPDTDAAARKSTPNAAAAQVATHSNSHVTPSDD